MPVDPIARTRKSGVEKPYDHDRLSSRIHELLKKANESMRQASIRSGLDHQAVRRIITKQRPNMTTCVLLARHFDINANEILELAGWPAMEAFSLTNPDLQNLPPEAASVALDIARIKDPGTRKQVAEAIRTLLAKYFD
jgi:lambda repressor-like predicted transcriptional regulator